MASLTRDKQGEGIARAREDIEAVCETDESESSLIGQENGQLVPHGDKLSD